MALNVLLRYMFKDLMGLRSTSHRARRTSEVHVEGTDGHETPNTCLGSIGLTLQASRITAPTASYPSSSAWPSARSRRGTGRCARSLATAP